MNIERNFEATLWRHRWRHHHNKLFWHYLERSFHISYLCSIFQNFQNGTILSSRQTFFTESYTGSSIYQKDSHQHFRYFELLIDALTHNINGYISISKFDLFCDLVTSSMTSWKYIYIIVVIISLYLYTGSLVMISLLVFFNYHEKCR